MREIRASASATSDDRARSARAIDSPPLAAPWSLCSARSSRRALARSASSNSSAAAASASAAGAAVARICSTARTSRSASATSAFRRSVSRAIAAASASDRARLRSAFSREVRADSSSPRAASSAARASARRRRRAFASLSAVRSDSRTVPSSARTSVSRLPLAPRRDANQLARVAPSVAMRSTASARSSSRPAS